MLTSRRPRSWQCIATWCVTAAAAVPHTWHRHSEGVCRRLDQDPQTASPERPRRIS